MTMSQSHFSGMAEVNGTKLYYEVAGTGHPLVFIPGFTLDTRMWDDQFEYFAQYFQVIRYDMRGFGKSAVPTEQVYSHVADLKALLDHLEVRQPHLVGLSKGGAVALDFTLTHPQYVHALVLIDTVLAGYNWSAEGEARDDEVWEKAREGGIPAAKESWLTHPLFAPARRQPAVAARLAKIVEDYSGWHFIHHNHEQDLEPPAAQRLHEINAPTLVIVGELDLPDFRGIAELLSRMVPHVQKVVIPDTGHMSNMEAPGQVNEAIFHFLHAR
jgi:3-oxoadipate enol-lactonase